MTLPSWVVRVAAVGLVVGVVMPFLVSIVFMLVSSRIGNVLLKIMVPFSMVPGLQDGVVTGLNGCLYAIIFVVAYGIFKARS